MFVPECVVVKDIQPSKVIDSRLDHLLNLFRIPNVGVTIFSGAAGFPNERHGFLTTLVVHVGHNELGTVCGQEPGRRSPNSSGRTSHNGDMVREPHWFELPQRSRVASVSCEFRVRNVASLLVNSLTRQHTYYFGVAVINSGNPK
jgi:hypothetical protein